MQKKSITKPNKGQKPGAKGSEVSNQLIRGPVIRRTFDSIPRQWKYVLCLFVALKITFLIVGYIGLAVLQPASEAVPQTPFRVANDQAKRDVSENRLISMWYAWDSFVYRNLTATSYTAKIDSQDLAEQAKSASSNANLQRFAFPPVYPVLAKLTGKLLGGHNAIALLIISNGSFIGLLYFAYGLGVRIYKKREDAERFVKYLVLLPTAFLFQAALTEALFLFLVLGAFYFAESRRWVWAALFGMVAAATRSMGVLLVIPLALLLLEQHDYSFKNMIRLVRDGIWLALVPVGWLSFMVYCKAMTGDWLAYSHIQQAGWGVVLQNPLPTLWHGMFERPFIAIRAWIAAAALAITVLGARLIRPAYVAYALLFILMPLSLGPVQSFTSLIRYMVVAFPVAMVLSVLAKNKDIDMYTTIFLAVLQGGLMVLWVNYWLTFII